VFCASLADLFDNAVDPQWRADLFALVAATPNLDWLLLTKRVGNVRSMVPPGWLKLGGWPTYVRIGITVVEQPEADRDIALCFATHSTTGALNSCGRCSTTAFSMSTTGKSGLNGGRSGAGRQGG
jgi:hypothetical protein